MKGAVSMKQTTEQKAQCAEAKKAWQGVDNEIVVRNMVDFLYNHVGISKDEVEVFFTKAELPPICWQDWL